MLCRMRAVIDQLRRACFVAVLVLPCWAGAATASETIEVVEGGAETVKPSSDKRVWDHPGHIITSSDVKLSSPQTYHGLMIERMTLTNEWRCEKRQHRISRRIYYTANGRFVRAENTGEDWSSVPKDSPLEKVLKSVCS